MMALKLIAALVLPWLFGAAALAALLREGSGRLAWLERLALSLLLGAWLLVVVIFLLPFVGLPPTLPTIISVLLIITVGCGWLGRKALSLYLPGPFDPRPPGPLAWVLSLLIGWKIATAMFASYLPPIIGPDLITCYGFAAKQFFFQGTPLSIFGEPPFPNLLMSWTPLMLGTWQDNLLGLFYPLFLPCLAVIFYYTLIRRAADLPALGFTFLLVALPFLRYHAGTAYADFPLAVYYTVSTLFLWRYLKEQKREDLLITLLFLGAGIWIKKSGSLYALINLAVLGSFWFAGRRAGKKYGWREILPPLGLFLLAALPWLLFERAFILADTLRQVVHPSDPRLAMISEPAAFPSLLVLLTMLNSFFLQGNWQLLWPLLLALLALYPHKALRPPYIYMLALLGLQLLGLFILFRFTGEFVNLWDDSLLNRLALHFTPVALLLAAELTLDR